MSIHVYVRGHCWGSFSTSLLVFETRSLAEPGARLAALMALSPHGWGYSQVAMAFYMDAGDLSSGTHACTVSTLTQLPRLKFLPLPSHCISGSLGVAAVNTLNSSLVSLAVDSSCTLCLSANVLTAALCPGLHFTCAWNHGILQSPQEKDMTSCDAFQK